MTLPYLLLVLLTGFSVSLWALVSLGWASYSPLPKPKKKGTFRKKGAYKFVRHPFYLGTFIVGLALLLSRPVPPAILFFLAFVLLTDIKANLEEKLLANKYQKYQKYKEKTAKYIPFLS